MAENKTGYSGVRLSNPGQRKPYRARVWRGGKTVTLGTFRGGAVRRAVASGAGGGVAGCSRGAAFQGSRSFVDVVSCPTT